MWTIGKLEGAGWKFRGPVLIALILVRCISAENTCSCKIRVFTGTNRAPRYLKLNFLISVRGDVCDLLFAVIFLSDLSQELTVSFKCHVVNTSAHCRGVVTKGWLYYFRLAQVVRFLVLTSSRLNRSIIRRIIHAILIMSFSETCGSCSWNIKPTYLAGLSVGLEKKAALVACRLEVLIALRFGNAMQIRPWDRYRRKDELCCPYGWWNEIMFTRYLDEMDEKCRWFANRMKIDRPRISFWWQFLIGEIKCYVSLSTLPWELVSSGESAELFLIGSARELIFADDQWKENPLYHYTVEFHRNFNLRNQINIWE